MPRDLEWREFSAKVPAERYVGFCRTKRSIADRLGSAASVEIAKLATNEWHNKGRAKQIGGFQYVDQDCSHFGNGPVLLGEASVCILLIAIDNDPNGAGNHFVCHIAADSSAKENWKIVISNFGSFMDSISNLGYLTIYMFSSDLKRGEDGSYEHGNVMDLLLTRLSKQDLETLAVKSVYLIEGEAGQRWNSYCSVRFGNGLCPRKLRIVFATDL